jgi:hypothetical protein
MGIFVNYLSNPFSNLDDNPTTAIVETSLVQPHTIWVQAIIITNLGNADIGINLKFVRSTPATEIFLVKNFSVPAFNNPKEFKDKTLFNTVDLVDVLGIKKNLQYGIGATEKLICYSNGYTQKFDCCVEYSVLNDLP